MWATHLPSVNNVQCPSVATLPGLLAQRSGLPSVSGGITRFGPGQPCYYFPLGLFCGAISKETMKSQGMHT